MDFKRCVFASQQLLIFPRICRYVSVRKEHVILPEDERVTEHITQSGTFACYIIFLYNI